jgi:hypothetical protein
MDILSILQLMLGLVVIFIASGFIIVQRYFRKHSLIEKIIYTVTISICITVLISLALGILGIFNSINFMIVYLLLSSIIFGLSFIKRFNHETRT